MEVGLKAGRGLAGLHPPKSVRWSLSRFRAYVDFAFLRHYLKSFSGWNKAFSRLIGIVRSAVRMDLDIVEALRLYGMAVKLLLDLKAPRKIR